MEPGQWNTEPDQTERTVFGAVCEQCTKTTLDHMSERLRAVSYL
jgi:hypothetical protein